MAYEIIFGKHAVLAALKRIEKFTQTTLFISASQPKAAKHTWHELAREAKVNVQPCSHYEMEQMSKGENHQGVLLQAVALKQQERELDLMSLIEAAGDKCLILILDGLQDPHNLGACLRTADATGVTAVIVPKDKSCGITPAVRKVASGAAETVPLITVTNIARTMDDLKDAGCWTMGLAGEADQSLYDCELTGPQVIVMGAEGQGLRRLTKEKCDFLSKLPMHGEVSSLNVSVATGVVLYEVLRQRAG